MNDHTLFAAAIAVGVVTWEPLAGDPIPRGGTMVFGPMRYFISLDDDGVPIFPDDETFYAIYESVLRARHLSIDWMRRRDYSHLRLLRALPL